MTHVIKGQTVSFGATHIEVKHEVKGAIVIGDDGTFYGRVRSHCCRKAFVRSQAKTMAISWCCRASSMRISIFRNTACWRLPAKTCSIG